MVQELHFSTCLFLVRCRLQAAAHSSLRGLHHFPHLTISLAAAQGTAQQSPNHLRMRPSIQPIFSKFITFEHESSNWLCSCPSGIYLYVLCLLPWLIRKPWATKCSGRRGALVLILFEMFFTSSHSTSAVPLLWH